MGKSKETKEDEDDLEDELEDEDGEPEGPVKTTFELNDTLWAEATLDETDRVYLWLGVSLITLLMFLFPPLIRPQASVMLEYTQEEAVELLSSKLSAAQQNLSNTIEDLEFLREQITVMEVNTARCYNWDVKRRREKKEALRAAGAKDEDLLD